MRFPFHVILGREALGNCLFGPPLGCTLSCVGAVKRSVFKSTLILRLQITGPQTWPDALRCAPQVETCPTSPACSDYDREPRQRLVSRRELLRAGGDNSQTAGAPAAGAEVGLARRGWTQPGWEDGGGAGGLFGEWGGNSGST